VDDHSRCTLCLLGQFELNIDQTRIFLSRGVERVIALLALSNGVVSRTSAASKLWPDVAASRADANLRSSLYRLSRTKAADLVERSASRLWLSTHVRIDLREWQERLRHLPVNRPGGNGSSHRVLASRGLTEDLLEDWCEEWHADDQRRWRLLRLNTLTSLATEAFDAKRHREAAELALHVIAADPFRENAQRVLVESFIALGSWREASWQASHYREIMLSEFGLEVDLLAEVAKLQAELFDRS
jgi:DNA-binding SARP family transcriptional activator